MFLIPLSDTCGIVVLLSKSDINRIIEVIEIQFSYKKLEVLRKTWKIPSTARIWDKKLFPSPWPACAPLTNPAISWISKNAETWPLKHFNIYQPLINCHLLNSPLLFSITSMCFFISFFINRNHVKSSKLITTNLNWSSIWTGYVST